MIRLIWSDLQKVRRRRGLFWGAGIMCTLTALVALVIRILEHRNDPGAVTNVWGFFDGMSLVVLICSVIAGAILGSWDQARGTQRYLLMGGAKRSSLLLAHAVATILYSVLLSAWVLLILGTVAVAFPGSGGFDVSPHLQMIGVSVLAAAVFALIAFSIGAFFAEVGIAVAISIVAIFAADLISALLAFIGSKVSWLKGAEHGMITNALTNLEQNTHLASSALIITAWIAACLGLAWLRISRRDY